MARKRTTKPRSYHEPWRPSKSKLHGSPPVLKADPDEHDMAFMSQWERVDQNADWILWGSGMADPTIAIGYLSGKPQVLDDQGIIAVRRHRGVPEGSPTNEDVCKRIAECINAMEGVADPATFISDVRSLLFGYAMGEQSDDPRSDARVLRLLDQCLTLQEREEISNA